MFVVSERVGVVTRLLKLYVHIPLSRCILRVVPSPTKRDNVTCSGQLTNHLGFTFVLSVGVAVIPPF